MAISARDELLNLISRLTEAECERALDLLVAGPSCPACGERDTDNLIWQNDETHVTCWSCGHTWDPQEHRPLPPAPRAKTGKTGLGLRWASADGWRVVLYAEGGRTVNRWLEGFGWTIATESDPIPEGTERRLLAALGIN
jgi:uncharacterized metal-binding protein (TIGR02443 family)